MRIGIAGAQGTGKTTLLNALRDVPLFSTYEFCDEVTRKVKALGLDINKGGNAVTQRMIMFHHIYNLHMFSDSITDRTVLDCAVYTKWLYDEGKVDSDTFRWVNNHFVKLIKEYDRLFFIEPEFDIVSDGVRDSDQKWQHDINESFEEYIDMFDLNVEYLTGSVANRVAGVIEGVKQGNE